VCSDIGLVIDTVFVQIVVNAWLMRIWLLQLLRNKRHFLTELLQNWVQLMRDSKAKSGVKPIAITKLWLSLVVGSDGTATAMAHFSPKLNEASNYIVNVHASPTNLGTIVACGDYND